jgi:copper chaperone CopZ
LVAKVKEKTMAKKGIWLGMLVMVFGMTVTGCATRLGAFTVISTKNIDWSRASEFTRSNQRVEGEDMYHIIILIPTKFNITIEDAVDKALQKVPGAIALVDAVLRSKSFYIPYIYGRAGYYVEGNILVDPKLASNDGNSTTYLVFYTEDGQEFKEAKISEAEFLSYLQ